MRDFRRRCPPPTLRSLRRTAVLLVAALLSAGSPLAGDEAAVPLVIVDVTVIDPATGRVETGRDVEIRGARIAAIVPSGESQPSEEATVVEGAGRFLIPGLWDLHVHLDMHTDTDLAMLVGNGVLSVRDMGGDPFLVADLERRIEAGELIGPAIYAAGSILEDRRWLERARQTFPELEHRLPVDNPEEARATIALLASWGVDLVKVRNLTDRETLQAILDAAHTRGLTVAGHEPLVVDIDEAARMGMTTFEHLPFLTLTLPGKEADEERLAAAVEGLRASGSYVVPTLIASRGLGEPRTVRAAAIDAPDDRYRYLPEVVKEAWVASLEADAGPLPWGPMRERSKEITRRLHEAGVPVLAGTDMGVPLTFPGFSLHDELALMVSEIGLAPLDALQAATSHAADLFGLDGGRVEAGAPADLVLLDADPLASIENVRRIRAVIRSGELFDRARIDRLFAGVEEGKDSPAGPSVWERMEAACRARPHARCLERLAGYRFSQGRYEAAHALYGEALAAGAGEMALEGRLSAAINALFGGTLECGELASAAEPLLLRHAADPDRVVGILDRTLAVANGRCVDAESAYLKRLATLERGSIGPDRLPIFLEHYATYLYKVEGDEKAAYALRAESMPDGWRESSTQLQRIATWCLESGVALGTGRELAQQAQAKAVTPIDRLQSMMLEARIASAAGDHVSAVRLMETIDRFVPNNKTVQGLLEEFRRLAAEAGGAAETGDADEGS